MGAQALNSHAKGARHRNKTETVSHIKAETKPLTSYWAPKSEPAPEIIGTSDMKSSPSQEPNMDTSSTSADVDLATLHVPPPQDNTKHAAAQKSQSAIKNFVLTDDQWRAEVLWVMKTVKVHHSASSSRRVAKLFQRMLPDSMITSCF